MYTILHIQTNNSQCGIRSCPPNRNDDCLPWFLYKSFFYDRSSPTRYRGAQPHNSLNPMRNNLGSLYSSNSNFPTCFCLFWTHNTKIENIIARIKPLNRFCTFLLQSACTVKQMPFMLNLLKIYTKFMIFVSLCQG